MHLRAIKVSCLFSLFTSCSQYTLYYVFSFHVLNALLDTPGQNILSVCICSTCFLLLFIYLTMVTVTAPVAIVS
jgi:uncharacterized membrane protein